MNDDRRHDDHLPPGENEARALDALVRLPGATASAAARARARATFVGDAADGAERVPQRQPATRRPRRTWAALLVAAVLGALVVGWYGFQPVEQWVVLDVVNPAGIDGDGGALSGGDILTGGTLGTGPESELELQLGDQLRFRMVAGTSIELPRAPGRWFGRDRRFALTAGEVYGTTGGRKLDFGLVFATGELQAHLTGTTFAVFRTDTASCVCLWQGGITVEPLVGPSAPVVLDEEQRVWIYKDGRDPDLLPLSDMERMKLQMIHDAGIAAPAPGAD